MEAGGCPNIFQSAYEYGGGKKGGWVQLNMGAGLMGSSYPAFLYSSTLIPTVNTHYMLKLNRAQRQMTDRKKFHSFVIAVQFTHLAFPIH